MGDVWTTKIKKRREGDVWTTKITKRREKVANRGTSLLRGFS